MKHAVVLAVAAGLVAQAQAQVHPQAPDKLCDGLAAAVTAASDRPAFMSLGKDGPGIARPAGMEGAHSCDAERGQQGKADKLVCTWMLGGADGAKTLQARVKNCDAVRGWTEGKMAEAKEGVVSLRLIKPGSTLEVVALSMPSRGARIETLTVLAPKR
jgi:hypothetical protein